MEKENKSEQSQDIHYWNTDESLQRYFELSNELWDSEASLLIAAVQKLNKKIVDIKILDLGCGGGRTTVPLHNMGFDILGIDIAENLIKKMNEKYPDVKSVVGDACSLDFPDESFDIVIFSHNSLDCLYPYEKRAEALKEISRVLKRKGFFIFSSHVFNLLPYGPSVFKNIIRNIGKYIKSIESGYYDEEMGNGEIVKLYYSSLSNMRKELKENGMQINKFTRVINNYSSLIETFARSFLNWERYYLAMKN